MSGTDSPDPQEPGSPEDAAPADAPRKSQPLSEAFVGARRAQAGSARRVGEPPLTTALQVWNPGINEALRQAVSPDLLRLQVLTQSWVTSFRASVAPNLLANLSPLRDLAETLNRTMRAQWLPALARIGETVQNLFPPNWAGARPRDWDELKTILAREGIPLLWVPGPKTVAALFDAASPAERRKVINRRWKGIVTDCESVLEALTAPPLADDQDFALRCVDALRDGHWAAAQALAANLLDSVMRKFFSEEDRRKVTGNHFKQNGVTFDFDDYDFRESLTFAPVWCAHEHYWPHKGDPIPPSYGRHPSAHGVSRRQYKRVNAVIALMLVTSVIKFFDDDLARRGK